MAANRIFYKGSNTGPGLSPTIWASCPRMQLIENPDEGHFWFDNFLSFGGTVATGVGTYASEGGAYLSAEVGVSPSILQVDAGPTLAAPLAGVIRLKPGNADNNSSGLEAGYGNGASWLITGNKRPKLWFEARIRVAQVAAYDIFVGLAEKGASAGNFLISTSDALASKDLLGFYVLTAAGTSIVAAHRKGGGAAVTIGTGTIAANTWTKVGFFYDPDIADLLQAYQDGTKLGKITDATVATFPTKNLTPVIYVQATDTSQPTIDLDWWAAAQLY